MRNLLNDTLRISVLSSAVMLSVAVAVGCSDDSNSATSEGTGGKETGGSAGKGNGGSAGKGNGGTAGKGGAAGSGGSTGGTGGATGGAGGKGGRGGTGGKEPRDAEADAACDGAVHYAVPGCGASVKAACGNLEFCDTATVCGCDGRTRTGLCGIYSEPWAHTGPCADGSTDSGTDSGPDAAKDSGKD